MAERAGRAKRQLPAATVSRSERALPSSRFSTSKLRRGSLRGVSRLGDPHLRFFAHGQLAHDQSVDPVANGAILGCRHAFDAQLLRGSHADLHHLLLGVSCPGHRSLACRLEEVVASEHTGASRVMQYYTVIGRHTNGWNGRGARETRRDAVGPRGDRARARMRRAGGPRSMLRGRTSIRRRAASGSVGRARADGQRGVRRFGLTNDARAAACGTSRACAR